MLRTEDNELLVRSGPDTGMGKLLRRFWVPAMLSSEIPQPDCPPVRLRILNEDLVAFRDSDGQVGILDAYCPHRRANLFWGRNEECGLRCAYHGWKFDRDGNCVDLPNVSNGELIKSNIKTTAYPAVERSGMIWCYMGPAELKPKLPEAELFDLPQSHRYIEKVVIPTNWIQSLEGDIDSSHVGFLHKRLDEKPLFQGQSATVFEDKAPRWTVKNADYGIMLAARREAGPDSYLWRVNQWLMPFATLIAHAAERPFITNIRVPIDDENSIHYRVYARYDRPLTNEDHATIKGGVLFPEMIPGTFNTAANKSNDYLIDRQVQKTGNFTGIKAVPVQDYAVTSDQGGGPIADRSKERLTSSDAAIVMMRKKLLDGAKALVEGTEPPEAQRSAAYRVRSVEVTLPRNIDGVEETRKFTDMTAAAR